MHRKCTIFTGHRTRVSLSTLPCPPQTSCSVVEHQTSVREVEGSNPGRTQHSGSLNNLGESAVFVRTSANRLDFLVLPGKDYKL